MNAAGLHYWVERLSGSAERAAIKAASMHALSETNIAKAIAAGKPPTEAELAANRRMLGLADAEAEKFQRLYEEYEAKYQAALAAETNGSET
jgi:hypothetical protein